MIKTTDKTITIYFQPESIVATGYPFHKNVKSRKYIIMEKRIKNKQAILDSLEDWCGITFSIKFPMCLPRTI